MPEWWPAVVFGWPAVVVSLSLAAAGIARRKPIFVLIAVVLAAPFSLYLSGSPSWIALTGPGVLLTLIGSAYAVKLGRERAAWYLLIPFVTVATWLAVIVWTE